MTEHRYHCAYALLCVFIPRVYVWIIGVDYVHLSVIDKIPLVTVTLVRIKIDDHNFSNAMMCTGTVNYESNVRVYTEATSMSSASMMVTAG